MTILWILGLVNLRILRISEGFIWGNSDDFSWVNLDKLWIFCLLILYSSGLWIPTVRISEGFMWTNSYVTFCVVFGDHPVETAFSDFDIYRLTCSFWQSSNFRGIHVKKQLCFFSGWLSMILWLLRLLILSTVWVVDSDSPSNFRGMHVMNQQLSCVPKICYVVGSSLVGLRYGVPTCIRCWWSYSNIRRTLNWRRSLPI